MAQDDTLLRHAFNVALWQRVRLRKQASSDGRYSRSGQSSASYPWYELKPCDDLATTHGEFYNFQSDRSRVFPSSLASVFLSRVLELLPPATAITRHANHAFCAVGCGPHVTAACGAVAALLGHLPSRCVHRERDLPLRLIHVSSCLPGNGD